MNNFLIALLTFIVPFVIPANSTWEVVDKKGSSAFYDVIENYQGEFIAVGYSNYRSYGGQDMFFCKYDETGKLIEKNNLGLRGNDVALDIELLPDGNYLISGSTAGETEAILIKLGQDLKTIWYKSYKEALQNKFIGTKLDNKGQLISILDGPMSQFLVISDAQGNLIKKAEIVGVKGQVSDFLIKNDKIYLVGQRNNHAVIFCADKEGKRVWSKDFKRNIESGFNEIIINQDDNLVALGYKETKDEKKNGYFFVCNDDGDEIGRTPLSYGGYDDDLVYTGMLQPDGSILTAGESLSYPTKGRATRKNIFFKKIDKKGVVSTEAAEFYAKSSSQNDHIYASLLSSKGQLIFAGSKNNFIKGSDALLISYGKVAKSKSKGQLTFLKTDILFDRPDEFIYDHDEVKLDLSITNSNPGLRSGIQIRVKSSDEAIVSNQNIRLPQKNFKKENSTVTFPLSIAKIKEDTQIELTVELYSSDSNSVLDRFTETIEAKKTLKALPYLQKSSPVSDFFERNQKITLNTTVGNNGDKNSEDLVLIVSNKNTGKVLERVEVMPLEIGETRDLRLEWESIDYQKSAQYDWVLTLYNREAEVLSKGVVQFKVESEENYLIRQSDIFVGIQGSSSAEADAKRKELEVQEAEVLKKIETIKINSDNKVNRDSNLAEEMEAKGKALAAKLLRQEEERVAKEEQLKKDQEELAQKELEREKAEMEREAARKLKREAAQKEAQRLEEEKVKAEKRKAELEKKAKIQREEEAARKQKEIEQKEREEERLREEEKRIAKEAAKKQKLEEEAELKRINAEAELKEIEEEKKRLALEKERLAEESRQIAERREKERLAEELRKIEEQERAKALAAKLKAEEEKKRLAEEKERKRIEEKKALEDEKQRIEKDQKRLAKEKQAKVEREAERIKAEEEKRELEKQLEAQEEERKKLAEEKALMEKAESERKEREAKEAQMLAQEKKKEAEEKKRLEIEKRRLEKEKQEDKMKADSLQLAMTKQAEDFEVAKAKMLAEFEAKLDSINQAKLMAEKQFIHAVWTERYLGNADNKPFISQEQYFSISLIAESDKPLEKNNFKVYVNERLREGAKFDRVKIKKGKKNTAKNIYAFSDEVLLDVGLNTINVYVQNESGKTSTGTIKVQYSPAKPNLYLYSIGIPHEDLSYTTNDAADFAQHFLKGSKSVFEAQFSKVFNTAGTTNKLSLKIPFSELAQNERVSPQIADRDLMVIFISTHGYTKANELFLKASDFNGIVPEDTSINLREEILELLAHIPCKKLIFIDACQSGGGLAAVSGQKDGDENRWSTTMVDFFKAKSGLKTLFSCNKNEYSYEDAQWKNGAFTESIVKAITTEADKADKNGNKELTVKEIYEYISSDVPRLIKQKGNTATKQNPVFFEDKAEDYPVIMLR